MQNSAFDTLQIATVGTPNPTTIAKAALVPYRVVIRNVGAVLLFISAEVNSLASVAVPLTASYRLPPGTADVFVIAPKQGLYAVGSAAGGFASISISEAFPVPH